MVECVVEAGDEPQGRQARETVALKHESRAHAEENDPHVLDRVIGEQPLQVVLHQRVEHTEQRRNGPQAQHDPAPPRRATTEQIEGNTHEPVDPHLDDHAGQQRGDMARRDRMRHWQPHMERDHAGLGPEADQREEKDHVAGGGWERRRPHRGKRARHVPASEDQERGHQGREPGVRHREVPVGSANGAVLVMLDEDQEVGRERHRLPGHEECERVVRQYLDGK